MRIMTGCASDPGRDRDQVGSRGLVVLPVEELGVLPLEEAMRGVAGGALRRPRPRIAVGARHTRGAPGRDLAVDRRRIVADRADITAQHCARRFGHGNRSRAMTGRTSHPADPAQLARQLPPDLVAERARQIHGHALLHAGESAIIDARLTGGVTGHRAVWLIGSELAREGVGENRSHRSDAGIAGRRRVTLGSSAIQGRLVVATHAHGQGTPGAVFEQPPAHVIGGQLGGELPGDKLGGGRGRPFYQPPFSPGEEHAMADRQAGNPVGPRDRGNSRPGLELLPPV